jgi:hypothetical protein
LKKLLSCKANLHQGLAEEASREALALDVKLERCDSLGISAHLVSEFRKG